MDLDVTLRDYMRERLRLHHDDAYKGVPMLKFPEDLRCYERFMWEMRANTVIELGTSAGGSARWFLDRLRDVAPTRRWGRRTSPTVVTVDVTPKPRLPAGVVYLRGDVRDPDLPARVAELLPDGARPFVIEDTAHTYETTTAALTGFSRFVPAGGFFVVEDAVVDIEDLRIRDDWPRGVAAAINEWIAQHPEFVQVASPYIVTCHPGGFLRRSG